VSSAHVLVVDDEENIRHTASVMLKRAGYSVDTAEHGLDALERLDARDYDVALCDIRMPECDGLELLAKLRERRMSTTVIMMSAYADKDDALAAIHAGATDFIEKPFRRDELLFTLQKAIERRRLRAENAELKRVARGDRGFAGIVSRSAAMEKVFATIDKVADYRSTVLLSGESGTGKEMVARALHTRSSRADKPFVAVNCGAIPEALLESELFGHVRGAFTDANRDRIGLFEEANGGTLFLDEIGDMPTALQVKLLRVLQENEIRRVGEGKTRPVDVRVIAASVHDLSERVREGFFREDLYYRLNVLPIHLPPLRERREDIPLLVEHFTERYIEITGAPIEGVSPQAMRVLTDYGWPGNVRELENIIERAVVLSDTAVIGVEALPDIVRDTPDDLRGVLMSNELSIKKSTKTLEAILIRRALEETGGNRTAAAKLLEISHRALLYKLKDYFPDGVPGDPKSS